MSFVFPISIFPICAWPEDRVMWIALSVATPDSTTVSPFSQTTPYKTVVLRPESAPACRKGLIKADHCAEPQSVWFGQVWEEHRNPQAPGDAGVVEGLSLRTTTIECWKMNLKISSANMIPPILFGYSKSQFEFLRCLNSRQFLRKPTVVILRLLSLWRR